MNRWVTEYNQIFTDSQEWKNILSFTSNEIPKDVGTEHIESFARFNKIIKFITEAHIDPDRIPFKIFNEIKRQIGRCNTFITETLDNAQHIEDANNYLDEIFILLQPAIIPTKASATAITKAFNEYHKTMTNALEETQRKNEEIIDTITKIEGDIKIKHDKITNFSKYLFGFTEDFAARNMEDLNLNETIQTLFKQFKEHSNEINEFYQRLITTEEENGDDIGIIEKITDAEEKVEAIVSNMEEQSTEIRETYNMVFGVEGDDAGTAPTIGLRKELEEYDKEQTGIIEKLKDRINNLLSGATSVGLASAYNERKDEAAKKEYQFTWLFGATVGVLLLIGIFSTITLYNIETLTLNQLFISLLYKLPYILPLLWFAIFFSKRRSEQHRLEQEYAHKEALAKSYDSYKKQIEELNETEGGLLKHLIEIAIFTIGKNPAETLDKTHGEDTPFFAFFNGLFKRNLPNTDSH